MKTDGRPAAHPKCDLCKHFHEFELPDEVFEAARQHRLVIFAGAGVSTEVPSVMPFSFFEEIALDLGKNPKTITTTFPDLMSEFCAQPNGRRKLIQKIKDRFDYIGSFPTILEFATRFHRELSTVPHLDEIITTNWDPYFEEYCGATPFVVPHDFVFWDVPGRKVFKIHGSVSNYGSIVATNDDYDRCHDNLVRGIVGSNLKMLLATKVVVFVGYSFRDHDFTRIYDFLKSEMHDMLPHAYAVVVSRESADRFKSLGLTPVVTDGEFFLQVLKDHLIAANLMVPDHRFDGILGALIRVQNLNDQLHKVFSYQDNPELAICGSYQDGLTHAFGRILQRKISGEYSCPDHVRGLVRKYQGIQSEKRKRKAYLDVAYIEGYSNGLLYLVLSDKDRKDLPLYFAFGNHGELRTLRQYKQASRIAKEAHRGAYAEARLATRDLGEGLVFHHRPFIF